MTTNPSRRPAGSPVGGQFAPSPHPESGVALDPTDGNISPTESTPGPAAGTGRWRVIGITDTRALVEDGDRWVRVPGSGLPRACDRCGRQHEVHVDVEAPDGARSTVGTGCSDGPAEMASHVRSVASAQATAARAEAQQQAEIAYRERRNAAARAAVDLAIPEVVRTTKALASGEVEVWATSDGEARVWVRPDADRDERMACLESAWRQRQADLVEPRNAAYEADDTERRLSRARQRLATLLESGVAPSP